MRFRAILTIILGAIVLTVLHLSFSVKPAAAFYNEAIPSSLGVSDFYLDNSFDTDKSSSVGYTLKYGVHNYVREPGYWWGYVNVVIGETDDLTAAREYITAYAWADVKDDAADVAAADGYEIWEEEQTSLFGHPARHYAYVITKTDFGPEDPPNDGSSVSWWTEGNTFKMVAIKNRGSDLDFRYDILNPILDWVEAIDVPRSSTPTSTATPTPTSTPTSTPTTTVTPTSEPYSDEVNLYYFIVNESSYDMTIRCTTDEHPDRYLSLYPGQMIGEVFTFSGAGFHYVILAWNNPYTGEEETYMTNTRYFSAGQTVSWDISIPYEMETPTPTTTSTATATPSPTATETQASGTSQTSVSISIENPRINLEPGEDEYLEFAITNTGDAPALNVMAEFRPWDNVTVSETEVICGNIQPGETWRPELPPYVIAGEPDSTGLQLAVRGSNFAWMYDQWNVVIADSQVTASSSAASADLGIIRPAGELPQPREAVRDAVGDANTYFSSHLASMELTTSAENIAGIEASFTVQGRAGGGTCRVGDEIVATLTIANTRSTATPVMAAIFLPEDGPDYEITSYATSYYRQAHEWETWYDSSEHSFITNMLMTPGQIITGMFETLEAFTWANHTGPLQFYYGGGAYILEPGYMLIFTLKAVPQEAGELSFLNTMLVAGKDQPVETLTVGEMIIPFALGITTTQVDMNKLEHVAHPGKTIEVKEARSVLGGLFSRWL